MELRDLLKHGARPSDPETMSTSPLVFNVQSQISGTEPSLGDFGAIFKFLRNSESSSTAKIEFVSSDDVSAESESYSTAASSPPEAEYFDSYVKESKGVRWKEDVEEPIIDSRIIVKIKRKERNIHNARPAAESTSRSQGISSELESDFDASLLTPHSSKHHGRRKAKAQEQDDSATKPFTLSSAARLFTPAWVTPPPVQTPQQLNALHASEFKANDLSSAFIPEVQVDPAVIAPLLYLTYEEKKLRLANKLLRTISNESASLLITDLPRAISHVGGNTLSTGIHVFVDSSNITIGFQNALKKARNMNIHAYTKRPPMSFHSLALVMERGRGVAKRILVGSSRSNTIPEYMEEAVECGYEVSSLERVEKYRTVGLPGIERRNKRGSGGGYGTSGQSSGSETPFTATVKKMAEQGVDEILHMKMLESLVDAKEPSTIVLASGDAAEAEYSSGFLRNVERALEKGWKVELVAWKDSMSYAYRSREFLKKWQRQFRIIELDDFSEELLAIYVLHKPSRFGRFIL